ncbi:MAG TPA: hypothetical protein PKM26_05135 [Syntrophorhabdaceae bacterium]|nr:hypothetical protein [Syntrophorhabdaceae bacterium]
MAADKGGGMFSAGLADMKPTSLMHALSEIENFSVAEMDADLPTGFVTTKISMEFTERGFITALVGTTFTYSESIISFLAAKGLIPIFTSTNPGIFESLFSYAMNLALPLSFALMIGLILFRTFRGAATKKLINSFLSGYVSTIIVLAIAYFLLENIVYYKVLTHANIAKWTDEGRQIFNNQWSQPYYLLMNIRSVLIPSGMFSLLASIGSAGIIIVLWVIGTIRSNRFSAFLKQWE